MIDLRRMMPRLAALLLPLLTAGAAAGAEFYAASLTLDPPRPFVGQPVSFNLEIVVSPGCELQNIQLGGLPGGTQFELGQLVAQPAVRTLHEGRSVDIHRFRSEGHARAPLQATVQPIVQFMLVQRRNIGFFSSWDSSQQRLRLPATSLVVRELPAAGRPADFGGAVGQFTLAGRLAPAMVMPQDIVTLTLEISGQGHLGESLPHLPSLDQALFKVYPATVKRGATPASLTLTQVIIPQSTQAVQVASARFTYFDTADERYRTATAGPFPLTFTTRQPDETPAVRNLAVIAPRQTDSARTFKIDAEIHREIRRTVPFAAALLAALAFIAAVRPLIGKLAWIAGVLIFAGVAWGLLTFMGQSQTALQPLAQSVRLRIAPGERARHAVEIPEGTPVLVLETNGDWIRVAARGRRGWIPESALRPPPDP